MRQNLADPPFECYFTKVIPPNNFWWLLRSPPHVLIFQANLSGPHLLVILPKFSAIPPFGPSVTTDPHPQVINNDRSLMSSLVCSREKCRLISWTAPSNEVLSILLWDSLEIELTLLLPFVPVIKCLLSYLSAILFMYASFHSGLTSKWWLWPWSKWYENLWNNVFMCKYYVWGDSFYNSYCF